ncbi:uL15m family ribosomal protein [Candidatus Nanohalobium constans]|uniref:Large ribosomal subunit protein uL15 n=1 Tax=Candidatus Nanohalobium constans TaxID=2565781 RepID=A0A5Q0UH30_9ARCH|nr:uL15m family ribosomal protein [Candidatus Nanohalobium constans]QGA80962.1 50S ribosomal protein L15 [Candidatus Nanohalobium constans]
MTKRRSKKNKSGSNGYGSSKKNRGAGSRGGRGNAGSGKKGQSQRMTEDGVQELGEKGFNSRQPDQDGINLRDIDQRIEEFVEQGAAEETENGYVFHAEEAGYDKVLGGGQLRTSIEIHSEEFSQSAEDKIAESDGEAVEE